VSDNFRQRLRSTSAAEAEGDWLDPHHDDDGQWFRDYGAGVFVEDARDVTVRGCRARRVQNGLVLERVVRAQVYDNDFSFLSGWGIALWRSSDNVLSRNACDFCIRGYSHGVYNRGQDSAGILLFEQSSRNLIAENSATHCGDGFFSFAGQEALGGVPPPVADFDHVGRGCNGNQIWGNDFSHAAAHGLEITFSFGNVIVGNQFTGNAICGIWAGYSRATTILANRFVENGLSGNGLERGGVNIEHGQHNTIQGNAFARNACGVHLWWDEDAHLAELAWVRANGAESRDERVLANTFSEDTVGIELGGPTRVGLAENRFERCPHTLKKAPAAEVAQAPRPDASSNPTRGTPLGLTRPVGARAQLGGREAIRIDEWGPVEPR